MSSPLNSSTLPPRPPTGLTVRNVSLSPKQSQQDLSSQLLQGGGGIGADPSRLSSKGAAASSPRYSADSSYIDASVKSMSPAPNNQTPNNALQKPGLAVSKTSDVPEAGPGSGTRVLDYKVPENHEETINDIATSVADAFHTAMCSMTHNAPKRRVPLVAGMRFNYTCANAAQPALDNLRIEALRATGLYRQVANEHPDKEIRNEYAKKILADICTQIQTLEQYKEANSLRSKLEKRFDEFKVFVSFLFVENESKFEASIGYNVKVSGLSILYRTSPAFLKQENTLC